MGRQIQVYALPDDANHLVQMLGERVGVTLLASRTSVKIPMEISSPFRTQDGFDRIDCVLVQSLSASILMQHVETQGYWSVDTLFSEAIEFGGCYFDGKTLKIGRLYYDTGFYENRVWKDKSPSFLGWAKSVFNEVKKTLHRDSQIGAYVGDAAEKWRAAGGSFVSIAVKGRPPILAG